MTVYLYPIWEKYLEHRSLDILREEICTYPWYEPPATATESLLMLAIEWRDLGAVELLLSMGENPRLPASDGFTFLHQAVDQIADAGAGLKSDSDEIGPRRGAALLVLQALLEAGADPNAQGMDGTPLHRAAGGDDIEPVRLLLAYGADIEARMLVDGDMTPLLHAARMGQLAMVRFLLDSGADRSAMSRPFLTDPTMTLRQLLETRTSATTEEILKILKE